MLKFLDARTVTDQLYNALEDICILKGYSVKNLEDMEKLAWDIACSPADASEIQAFLTYPEE